ncbi:MAG: winged helix-turn-helix domain-containing protein [Deltaproteobacteria bacterium]|nr:winged helix-turn-helix domain-containing protein [Deltaproteobacteria bacterium]
MSTSTATGDWGNGPTSARFQAALFSYHRGEYTKALLEFEKISERLYRSGDWPRFVESSIYVLRLLAEQEDFKKVDRIEARLRDIESTKASRLAGSVSPKLWSRLHYVLGICHVYRGQQHEAAMDRFRDSIQAAIECDDRSALAWPLYGAATVLYARDRHDDAIRELEKLKTLLSCCPVPEIASSAHLLHALILRNQGKLDQALQSTWVAFETLRDQPHLGLYLHTLATLGTIFSLKNDPNTARLYLDLARRSLKRSEFPRIARIVDEALEKTGGSIKSYDLELNLATGTLVEVRKGEIKFDGQFILRDLLRVFMEASVANPGATLSKEDLVREVWAEDYRPQSHDNKIYVNIKRLRRLIEPDDGSTEYILRGKLGYYLNPNLRIAVIPADVDHTNLSRKNEAKTIIKSQSRK